MSKEIIMAGEGSVPTEQGAVAPLPAGESQTADTQRLQKAQELLGTQLTDRQREAILEAHQVGEGEPGKDQAPAGIGNYTTHQLGEKIKILKEAGFSKEQWKTILKEGIAGLTVPDFLKEAKRTESRFEQLRKWVEDYDEKNIDMAGLTLDQKDEYRRSLEENLLEMGELVNEAGANGVLSYVTEDIRQIYAKVAPAPDTAAGIRRRRRRQSMYGDSSPELPPKTADERIAEVRSALADYQETFWDYGDAILRARFGTTDISGMKGVYQGVSRYVASKMATAIMKELKGVPLDPAGEIGDFFLQEIQRQFAENAAEAERQRQRQRRNAGPDEMLGYNPWRERFDFNWAETPEELERSVFVWIEKFEKHLPNETAEIVHQEVGKWKANAIGALEVAAHDLNISEKDPFYERLRSTIETYTNVLGGVKLLESDGGFEPYTGYLEAHAHNFNAHHDAIYLGNAKSAIVQHYLSRQYRGAISLGAPRTIEKPLAGDLEDFRGNIEEKTKEYAATHELYIRKEDFDRRKTENNDGYGWDDVIEELLLEDNRGMAAAGALTDPIAQAEAIAKVATRTGVFKEIKERLDQEDGLAGLTDDQRRDVIRDRIKAKIRLAGKTHLLDEINAMSQANADAALWKYVKDFNERMEKQGHSLWSPSAWDFVRLSINNTTKLIDRVLSEDELEAMIEEVGSFKGEIGTTGVSVEIEVDGLTDEEIKAKIDALPGLNTIQKKELLEDALFNKQQRDSEAERAFNINRSYQKFLGIDARWGGMVVRVVNDVGDTELKTIWEIAEERLKAKIDKEAADIEHKVTVHEARLRARVPPLSDAAIARATDFRRRSLRNEATFGATLGLREIGIANDLPIWNYYYYNDPQRIQTFAPLVGLTHNDKIQIVELLDRGRREMVRVFDDIADEFMDGKILVVRDEPDGAADQAGEPTAFHKETRERKRIINEATTVSSLRDVFESRFMLSTSGGIEVVDLIAKIADLGIYDLLWEMGCKNFREFQGFIKRRDEWELKRQSFWNTREWRDPISYAKRLRGAGAAITFLRGGEVKGQGRVPGVLIEPMSGSYTVRDYAIAGGKEMWDDNKSRLMITEWIEENFEHLSRLTKDKLIEVGVKVIKPLIDYMDARRYVMNRAGLAPHNWKYDNWHISESYFKELLRRTPMKDENGKVLGDWGAEVLGDEGLDYAILGRSPIMIMMYRGILQTSSYHTLLDKELKVYAKEGQKARASADVARRDIRNLATADPQLQVKLTAREQKLVALNTSVEERRWERQRIIDEWVEEKVHKEVTNEWAMQFAA